MRPWRRSVAAIALMGALASCGGDDGADAGEGPAAEPTATVTAESNDTSGAPRVDMNDALQFRPGEITVSVG